MFVNNTFLNQIFIKIFCIISRSFDWWDSSCQLQDHRELVHYWYQSGPHQDEEVLEDRDRNSPSIPWYLFGSDLFNLPCGIPRTISQQVQSQFRGWIWICRKIIGSSRYNVFNRISRKLWSDNNYLQLLLYLILKNEFKTAFRSR